MAKINFTSSRVDAHACRPPAAQSFIWDSASPGLGLRVTSAGAKAYIYQGKVNGRTARITVGDPRSWTLAAARSEARRLQTLVDAGIDPRDQKAKLRAEAEEERAAKRRAVITVADAWSDYVEYISSKPSPKTKKPRSAHYLRSHKVLAAPGGEKRKVGATLTARGPLADLMPLSLSKLTADVVSKWLQEESKVRPTAAGYAFRLLKAFSRWCEGQDLYSKLLPADCCSSPKVSGVVPSPNTRDGDSLQREQLKAWFAGVHSLGNPILAAYLQGLLITGARREELAALRWEDVDFRWNSLRIKDKVDGQRTIPLTPYLSRLLDSLPRYNDWVFSSPGSKSGRISEPRYAHNQAIEVAGLPHITLHGLRRSFGTLSEWVECPVGVVAQIQGHKPSAVVEKHYRRRPLDLLRMWHTKIETWLLKEAGYEFFGPDRPQHRRKPAQ